MYQALGFLRLRKFLCLYKLFLNLRKILILQLRSLLILSFLNRNVYLCLQLILLFTKSLKLGYGVLFIFPLGLLHIKLIPQLGKLLLQGGQSFLGKLILFLLQSQFLNLELQNPSLHLVHFLRHGIHLGFYHGTGLVHQVNGLVR